MTLKYWPGQKRGKGEGESPLLTPGCRGDLWWWGIHTYLYCNIRTFLLYLEHMGDPRCRPLCPTDIGISQDCQSTFFLIEPLKTIALLFFFFLLFFSTRKSHLTIFLLQSSFCFVLSFLQQILLLTNSHFCPLIGHLGKSIRFGKPLCLVCTSARSQ